MFSAEQKASLAAPLASSHVKSRTQGGRGVSYVEGWHVIAEANRIFGFDGWSRETIDLKCVAEKEREIGKEKAPGWGVTYIAKVRVRVGEIVREGCGTGHGIDRDLGQAHESALKESETDSMKRALMTFGNPFGLALYDKTQANVADEEPARPAPANRGADKAKEIFIAERTSLIAAFEDYAALGEWWNSPSEMEGRRKVGLDPSEVNALKEVVMKRRDEIKPPVNMLKAG